MEKDVKITKICAIGTNLRLMTMEIENQEYTIRISDKLYQKLKQRGVITAQKKRFLK